MNAVWSSRKISLQGHLILSALLTALPLVMLVIVLVSQRYYGRRTLVLQTNAEVAKFAASYVEGWTNGNMRTLIAIAQSAEVQFGMITEQKALITRQMRTQPDWENLFITDARGNILTSYLPITPGVSAGRRAYFRQARETRRPVVSNALKSLISGEKIIVIADPILTAGQFRGVVGVSVKPEPLHQVFDRNPTAATYVSVWGSDQRLIARTDTPNAYIGRRYTGKLFRQIPHKGSGALLSTSPVTGQEVFVGYAHVDGTPWVVFASTSARVAMAPVYREGLIYGLLAIVITAVSILLAVRLARQTAARVATIVSGANAIGQGYLDTRIVIDSDGELQQLASTINQMAANLAVSDRMKTELLALISHELRTPLTSIRSAVDLLHSGAITCDDPEYGELIDVMDRQTRHQQEMVENLIILSRAQAGTLRVSPHPTALAPLVMRVVDSFRERAEEKNVRVSTRIPQDLAALADGPRITLVLTNLLDNAVKFIKRGEITVRASAHADEVLVQVIDTGPGIPEEVRARLFSAFLQGRGDLMTRMADGAGLGLAVSRAIIEAHGGRIWVESLEGQGSTFSFTLPRVAADTPLDSNGRSTDT